MSAPNPGATGPAKAPWRTIYFRLEAPDAREVNVVGDFNDWDPGKHPLRKNANGVWECQMPLPAGRYTYCFVVDGVRRPDPQCQRRVKTATGAEECLIEVLPPTEP